MALNRHQHAAREAVLRAQADLVDAVNELGLCGMSALADMVRDQHGDLEQVIHAIERRANVTVIKVEKITR